MEQLSFRTAEFEGPLDLLLHLIAKHKLDIYDVQISALLEQYMAYIRAAQDADLELASEFLEMASRLVYIKTVSLLPRHEEETRQLKTDCRGSFSNIRSASRWPLSSGSGASGSGGLSDPRKKLRPIPHTV